MANVRGSGRGSGPDDPTGRIMSNMGEPVPETTPPNSDQPLYRIYADSKVPVSRAVGSMFKTKHNAARTAYTFVYESWNEVFRYYNHDQTKSQTSTRGLFKRGDVTENVVYSNVNTVLPAIYSKNPDISVNVLSGGQQDFQKALQALLNRLIRMKAPPGFNLKNKAKRAAMFAELCNQGVVKLDYIQKSESRDLALQQMAEIKKKITKAKKSNEVEQLYGQLSALEAQVETMEPSGYKAWAKLPHDIIVDPYAVEQDASDADWIMEHTFLPTQYLNARFAQRGKGDKKDKSVLVYKPTHKATFDANAGNRDDGMGLVMEAITGETSVPTDFTDQERLSYLYRYYTEVVYVWDKTARRILLFDFNDWTWPIWVWDDYLGLSRFFPYYFLQFSLSTGGMTSVGAASYYLDQQDLINDINRKMRRIRTAVFDFFFYNSNVVSKDEVEKVVKALRGETTTGERILGIKAEPQQKLSEVIESLGWPGGKELVALFDKGDTYHAIDRISATSDALRGSQFKANTTQDAVQAYVDATRIRVGQKIDVIEDGLAEIALSMAEIAVQFLDTSTVTGLIGPELAKGWRNCSVQDLHANYTVEIVAGSIEKPTSVFKKKEAIEVVQAIGQFAKVAPGPTLLVILRVLQNAFTEVVIKPEEWNLIQSQVMQFGQSFGQEQTQPGLPQGVPVQGGAPAPAGATPGAPAPAPGGGPAPPAPMPLGAPAPAPVPGGPPPPIGPGGVQPGVIPPGGGAPMDIRQMLMQLPTPVKLQALRMQQSGTPQPLIVRFLMQQVERAGQLGGRPLPGIPLSPAFKGVNPNAAPTVQ